MENFDEIKEQTNIDNSELEEIMKRDITPKMKREFIEVFKKSQFYLPVEYSQNMFEALEDVKVGEVFEAEGQVEFDIVHLYNADYEMTVPLFTSEEMFEKANMESSVMVMFASDIADMLSQSDKYSAVAVNPFSEYVINMPFNEFINLFREPTEEEKELLEDIERIISVLSEYSVELEENTTLFFKSNDNIMVERAYEGVFTSQNPIAASTNPEYGMGLKYTNILMMPKGKRILPIDCDDPLDVFIAPETEFKLQDVMNGTQNLWMCGDQPFYED